jgi:large subunit ribosomal protein L15
MIKENELRPAKGAVQKKTRRARGDGSGLGGEAGRGHKGQQSRSGYSYRSGFEGGQMPLYRRLPKKRGTGNRVFKVEYSAINLDALETHFQANETVDAEALANRGLMGKSEKYKILGVGELTKKLTIKAHKISKTALEKLSSSSSVFEQIK